MSTFFISNMMALISWFVESNWFGKSVPRRSGGELRMFYPKFKIKFYKSCKANEWLDTGNKNNNHAIMHAPWMGTQISIETLTKVWHLPSDPRRFQRSLWLHTSSVTSILIAFKLHSNLSAGLIHSLLIDRNRDFLHSLRELIGTMVHWRLFRPLKFTKMR